MLIDGLSKISTRVSDMGADLGHNIIPQRYVHVIYDYICDVLAPESAQDSNDAARRRPTDMTQPSLPISVEDELVHMWYVVFNNPLRVGSRRTASRADILVKKHAKSATHKQIISKPATTGNGDKQPSDQELVASAEIIRNLLGPMDKNEIVRMIRNDRDAR